MRVRVIEKEGGRCEKRQLLLLTPPSHFSPSLQDAECESRRRREAGGGQGERQTGERASEMGRGGTNVYV